MNIKVVIENSRCKGCGFCNRLLPHVFLLDEEGKSIASDLPIPPEDLELAEAAVNECPAGCIRFLQNDKLVLKIEYSCLTS